MPTLQISNIRSLENCETLNSTICNIRSQRATSTADTTKTPQLPLKVCLKVLAEYALGTAWALRNSLIFLAITCAYLYANACFAPWTATCG